MNTELERTSKDVALAYSKVMSRDLLIYSYYKNVNQNGRCTNRDSKATALEYES